MMKLFDIDPQKCTRCGICLEVCPTEVIEFKDKNSFPTPGSGKICINCGHCLATCPHDAFLLQNMPIEQCPPVKKNESITDWQLEHYLWTRRSIRAYRGEPVDREILARAIDITRFALIYPNGQPVHWLVVYERDEVKRMMGMVINFFRYMKKKEELFGKFDEITQLLTGYDSGKDPVSCGAPHIIVTHAAGEDPHSDITHIHFNERNCTAAITYLELLLPSFGIGSFRSWYFDIAVKLWPPLQKALGLPRTHTNCVALLVGYPKYKYYRLPLRNKPTVTWR
jgi:ferredoxin